MLLALLSMFPGGGLVSPDWSEVRAVLEARCLSCHGGERVKSGFRLATSETFLAGGDRGPVVDLEDPSQSRLLDAIRYGNPELAMPPTGELPSEELDILVSWVEAGAPWPAGDAGRLADPDRFPEEELHAIDGDWWAYRPLVPPPVPVSGVHPVDAFLEKRRTELQLEAAPRATPDALLRRATYDLTGLPPTPDERRAFLREIETDGFDAAWEELLERLLASPHYGEHWARHWLDLVRYAETNGYERDARKTNIWRYRDWVVRAYEADLPYDRFLIEQLAGDELEGLSSEKADAALIATGYYRLGVWDDEPADKAQARADETADIVDTTAQVFLGTAYGCARCHDHKADPITQRDYYRLTAFFNNVKGYGGGGFGQHLGGGMTRSIPDAPGPGILKVEERDARLASVERELARLSTGLGIDDLPPEALEERFLVHDARGGGTEWRYFPREGPDGWQSPGFDDSGWEASGGGFGRPGTPGALLGTEWTGERIHLRARFRLTDIPRTLVLTFHHDEDFAVYLNGQLVFERAGYRTDYTQIQLAPEAASALVVGSNVLAVACRNTGGGQYIDVGLRTGLTPAAEGDWIARLAAAVEAKPASFDASDLRAQLAERDQLLAAATTAPYPALVVSENGGTPPPQHILLRGSAHAPGELVEPGVPGVFLAAAGENANGPKLARVDSGSPSTGRRLALARWLVGEGAFLTARVQANRLWQRHFGRGICRSPGDFGRLGVEPTHPELLDHLACELIARGWSLKAMHRYLMRSEAYRMSSVGSARARELDPRNDLYARFDPRRLTAEEFRDTVLAVDGSLNAERFGPSVFPPLPDEVLQTASRPGQAWGDATPEQAARRSLYVSVKRSLRPPLMESFDQPDPDLPCPERFPTNVPTQALITMNGEFTREAAARFAQRLRSESPDSRGRVTRAIELALGRDPSEGELERGLALLAELEGERSLDEETALGLFALGLLNRNEFLWID